MCREEGERQPGEKKRVPRRESTESREIQRPRAQTPWRKNQQTSHFGKGANLFTNLAEPCRQFAFGDSDTPFVGRRETRSADPTI